jgi:hypothetical protein
LKWKQCLKICVSIGCSNLLLDDFSHETQMKMENVLFLAFLSNVKFLL